MRTAVLSTLLLVVTTCSADEYTIKTEDAGRFSVLHYVSIFDGVVLRGSDQKKEPSPLLADDDGPNPNGCYV